MRKENKLIIRPQHSKKNKLLKAMLQELHRISDEFHEMALHERKHKQVA